ncbi:MAG TPA: aminotransferase class V-fold PLP-dependent enzyme [Gammaproteobacteria bacterium]|nr:aminotransferase class V-fold PLP-dependent enzyme [Gammaproteobacteria bacterium]
MQTAEFQLDESLIYLNHAAVSPWPRRTADAVSAFAAENLAWGSRSYPEWVTTETCLRQQLQNLVNARSSAEIALLKNTSEALSIVAYGLSWQPGDKVVISNQEFPSNRIVWESLAKYGVTTVAADLSACDTPETALIGCLDDHTRLLSVSSVQYGTGLRLDLDTLGNACRERGILFCVDAIQSLGAVAFDAQSCHADFVMADGHKWMTGPEGIALFYCRAESMDRLDLKQYGWHMVEDASDYSRTTWEVAHSARRFECGSPNMTGIHALHASLELLLEVGITRIQAQVLDNTRFMLDFFNSHPDRFSLLTPQATERHAGIVTFRPLRETPESLHARLTSANVACALRGGGIRFSPHFYTPRPKVRAALSLLEG